MSSEPDPIASVTQGVASAGIEWTEEKIKEAIRKLKHHDLAFIEDSETINIAKEQRKHGEWDFFKTYVKDKNLRVLFQLGLTLRKLEEKKKFEEFANLQEKIRKKYAVDGLHVTYFVQNGLFSRYIANVLGISTSEKLVKEIKYLFENIEKTVSFISNNDDVDQKVREIVAKIHSNIPKTFIISSTQSVAMSKCKKIKEKVMPELPEYTSESQETEHRLIYILNKVNDPYRK